MHMKPYMHGDYHLYAKDVQLRNNNGTQRIYFFAKNEPKSGNPANLPRGYVVEVSSTGLPILRKDPSAALREQQQGGLFGMIKRFLN